MQDIEQRKVLQILGQPGLAVANQRVLDLQKTSFSFQLSYVCFCPEPVLLSWQNDRFYIKVAPSIAISAPLWRGSRRYPVRIDSRVLSYSGSVAHPDRQGTSPPSRRQPTAPHPLGPHPPAGTRNAVGLDYSDVSPEPVLANGRGFSIKWHREQAFSAPAAAARDTCPPTSPRSAPSRASAASPAARCNPCSPRAAVAADR
jgi:hypothetical protein